MNNLYVDYTLKLKQSEYDEKKCELLQLINDDIDTDCFEKDAISLLLTMQGLKDTINALKLLQPYGQD